MKLKTVRTFNRILSGTALALALLLSIVRSYNEPARIVLAVAVGILLVGVLVLKLVFWRCPHCGARLGRDVKQYCTSCGKPLDLE